MPTPPPTTSPKKDVQPTAVLSRPFYLAHRMAVLKVNPGLALPRRRIGPYEPPTPPDLVPPNLGLPAFDAEFEYHRVVKRWLYVFQRHGGKTTWIGEYRVDESGGYHPVDMKLAQGKERDRRPEPAKTPLSLLSLPYRINGKQVVSAFFLCGARLPLQDIRELETREWRLEEEMDWYDLDPELYKGVYYRPDKAGQHYLRVTDQLWYTVSVNKILQQVRDLAVGWMVPAKDLDPKTRPRSEQRARKKLLTEAIKDLRDRDPQDELGLVNEFPSHPIASYDLDGERVMREWLKDYERVAQWWFDLVEDAARALVKELDSRRMTFTRKAYQNIEKVDEQGFSVDMPLFLAEYGACLNRLTEAAGGAAWIANVIQNKGHFLQEYVLRQEPPEGAKFQAMRKSTAALLSIWKEFAVPYVLVRGRTSVVTLIDTLVFVGPPSDVRTALLDLKRALLDKDSRVARNLILPYATLPERALGWRLAPDGRATSRTIHTDVIVPKGRWEEARGQVSFSLDAAFFALECANLVVGITTLADKWGSMTEREKVWGSIGILGSSLDAMTAYGVLMQWRAGTLLKLGGLSAVIDTVMAVREAQQKKDTGDLSAAIGSGVAAGGSALVASASAMTLFGASTWWTGAGTVVAIVGTALVALGYVIALFSTDTPLEQFVAHSVWGHRHGQDSGKEPWSEGPFEFWQESRPDGLARQVTAMTNLMGAFTASGLGWTIEISCGLVHPRTKIHVVFHAQHDFEGTGKPQDAFAELEIDLWAERTTVLHPTDPKRNNVVKGTRVTFDKGVVRVAVDMWYFYSGHPPFPAEQPFPFHDPITRPGMIEKAFHMLVCSVRLDYFGDGTHWIPRSGKSVEFAARRFVRPDDSPYSSLNF